MAASETTGIFGEKLPAFVTAEKLAAAFGVTIQTVGNYVRAGMPVASKEPRRFDAVVCKVWRDQYRPQRGHGGKRDGSGKKPAFDASTVPNGAADDPVTRPGSVGEDLTTGKDDTKEIVAMLSKSPAELLELVGNDEELRKRLSPSGTKRFLDLVRGSHERHKLDLLLGETVKKDSVREVVGRHLMAVRSNLEGLPATGSAKLADALGLTPEQSAIVRNELGVLVRAIQRSIAANPLEESAIAGKIGNAA